MGTVVVITEKKGTPGRYGALRASGEKLAVFPLAGAGAAAADEAVDLAIIDCGADAEAGLCRLRELKQSRADVPIIFITDAGSEEVVLRAFRLGAREFFKKPFDTAEFTGAVEKILRYRRNSAGKPPSSGTKEGAMTAHRVVPDTIPERFLRAIDHMEKNLAASLSLDELARQACLSKYHFCRMFKKLLGKSPIRFLIDLRIRQAARLLRGAAVPINLVALRSGFTDLSEFNKQFKRLTGHTPSAYRKSL